MIICQKSETPKGKHKTNRRMQLVPAREPYLVYSKSVESVDICMMIYTIEKVWANSRRISCTQCWQSSVKGVCMMPNTVVGLEALQWIGHMSGIYHNKSKNRKLDVCIMLYRRLLFISEAKHKHNQTKYIAFRTCIVCGI